MASDDLLAVRDWQSSNRLGHAERAVLAATDDVVRDGVIAEKTGPRATRHSMAITRFWSNLSDDRQLAALFDPASILEYSRLSRYRLLAARWASPRRDDW